MDTENRFALGRITSKYVILEILVLALPKESCKRVLFKLCRSSRKYLKQNIDAINRRLFPTTFLSTSKLVLKDDKLMIKVWLNNKFNKAFLIYKG